MAKLAIRAGVLRQSPCFICQDPNSQIHHPDYRKPLGIVWLCAKHHRDAHKTETRKYVKGKLSRYTNEERARKGGYYRARKLTAKQRSESARNAAKTRWKNWKKAKAAA